MQTLKQEENYPLSDLKNSQIDAMHNVLQSTCSFILGCSLQLKAILSFLFMCTYVFIFNIFPAISFGQEK